MASSWTSNQPIFTARLRVIETAIPSGQTEKVTVAILLEDPNSGELFAAAPYNHPTSVAAAVDSSRFFAVRVVGDGGRKATLGVGFEERSDAFDFNIALQDASKTLGFPNPQQAPPGGAPRSGGASAAKKAPEAETPKDYSLKEGQTITVNIAGRGKTAAQHQAARSSFSSSSDDAAAAPVPFLPPPPSAADVKAGLNSGSPNYNTTPVTKPGPSAKDLGFDDGEFGEFQ